MHMSISPEKHQVGLGFLNSLGASALFLDEGTKYEVRATVTDPDGGAATKLVMRLYPRVIKACLLCAGSNIAAAEEAAQKLDSLLSDCCNPQGVAGEMPLDPGLALSRQQMLRSLQQLAQGRNLPGLNYGNRGQGRHGRGFAGSMARMSIRGPHLESRGEAGGPSGVSGAQVKGGGYRGSDGAEFPGAEAISAGSHGSAGPAAGNLRGVPVDYRDQAEAYFRRLAEEQSGGNGGP